MTKTATLDDFDRALLAVVQKNNLLPAREMARIVGLSESAVLRRLKRLRREKVIVADIAVVRAGAVGLPLMVHVLVSLEREKAADLDAFIRKLRTRPEVRHASYVTGDADFALVLHLAGMDDYEAFTREVFHADKNVKSFRTLVVIREVAGAFTASVPK
jgi:DNA-binding Lrp family transcriptional regulator